MKSPYRAPAAALRDPGPESPGPLPDVLAIVAGLGIAKLLTMVVSEEIVLFVADAIHADVGVQPGPFLWMDLVLSGASELLAFWAAWRLSRSRALRVPAIVAVLSLLITFAHRWVFEPMGFPLWYELALLATPAVALLVLYGTVRTTFKYTGVP